MPCHASHLHVQPAVEDHNFSATICEGTLRLFHHYPVSRFHDDLVRLAPVAAISLAVSAGGIIITTSKKVVMIHITQTRIG